MSTTFLMSNISPRTPGLNRRLWPRLEKEIHQAVKFDGEAWLFSGNACLDHDLKRVEPERFIGEDSVALILVVALDRPLQAATVTESAMVDLRESLSRSASGQP